MKDLMVYSSQVAILLFGCYLIYKTFFSKDALIHIQRLLLLVLIGGAFLLPVCRITIKKEIVNTNPAYEVPVLPVYPSAHLPETQWPIDEGIVPWWLIVLTVVYIAGAVAVGSHKIYGLTKANAILKKGTKKCLSNGLEVLIMPDDLTAFSFRNRIIMSESDYRNNYDMIVAHEAEHIKQRHGVDLLLVNIALVTQWFNPFIWLLHRELILIHELAADRAVIRSGIDAKKYQYLLISKSTCRSGLIPVVNHFRNGHLRKRIMKMKQKTNRLAQLKLLVIAPFMFAAVMAFAKTEYRASPSEMLPAKESFHMPYQGRIVAKYGKRIHPVSKNERMHTGVDIQVVNDTVRAPFSGIATFADHISDGYGNKLVVLHADGLETTYAHLAEILVEKGAKVEGGQPIAIVGNTGRSVSKHLHLECRVNGEITDPQQALPIANQ